MEILIDQINERIGLGLSVIGDELSDFVQISLGTGMETNHRHLLRALGGSVARGLAHAPDLLVLFRHPGGGLPAA